MARLVFIFITVISSFGQLLGQAHGSLLNACLPDLDMPFSNRRPDTISQLPGFYYELGELLSAKMGKAFQPYYTLSAFHKRPVREGLLAGNCIIQFGLPATEGPEYVEGEVALTHPVTDIGFALVKSAVTSIRDWHDLEGKTIAVLTGSPPQMALSNLENIKLEYCMFAQLALAKLANGEVDLAFIWGPEAGYLNKYLYKNKFSLIRTSYEWPVAIGIAKEEIQLKDDINKILKEITVEIEALKIKYGFPQGNQIFIPGIRYDFKD